MLIYLLRHGTTEWNAVHKIQGDTDTSLDDIGQEMARQTGLWFEDQGITFDKVFSSPLKRAYNTAKLASGSEDIVVDERLRELGFGNMEGLVVEDMLEKDKEFPFVYFKTKPDIYDEKVKNDSDAESLTQLCERTADFLQDQVEPLAKQDWSPDEKIKTVLISAHGACNKGLLMHMRGEKDMAKFWGEGLQPNCAFDVIEYDESLGTYRILSANNTHYDDSLTANLTKLL